MGRGPGGEAATHHPGTCGSLPASEAHPNILTPGASQIPPCEEDATWGRPLAEQWLAHGLPVTGWAYTHQGKPDIGTHSEWPLIAFRVPEPYWEQRDRRREAEEPSQVRGH